MRIQIAPERLARAKRAFATRTVPTEAMVAVSDSIEAPRAGDIVLARVTSVGQHPRIELTTSRKALMFRGDEIILAYGDRYAPDQFEAEVPDTLGPCEMVAAGGIAGVVRGQHARMREATQIEPIGVFVDALGRPLNLRDFRVADRRPRRKVPAIAVVGGSMNAGKTTTAASLVRGLTLAGVRVGAMKITGTGAGNDYWHMKDAGAIAALDFTDAGLATTYKASQAELERVAYSLSAEMIDRGAEALVIEIADGLFQQETSWLVGSRVLEPLVDAYLYAAESAGSAVMGIQWLRGANRPLLGVSGVMSQSPLACREVEAATGVRCLARDEVADPAQARLWLDAFSARMESAAA